jgi:2-polyprenyl-3-methyl-5-hydroxy-6-metoxy-1,4-benzoquinol methylase
MDLDLDPADVEAVTQRVRLELYRENLAGALAILEAAQQARPDPRYVQQAQRIRSWLGHLDSREAYLAAQEAQYRRLRWRGGLKLLDKRLRIWLGRKTRKTIARRARDPEFRLLEGEVRALGARRVLDGGAGEGGVALALAARNPGLEVEGVEASETNVRLARRLHRSGTVSFRQGLAEEVHRLFPPDAFDLVYSFAVLEHVRDVEETLTSLTTVLRPGGRFCFVVPMHEFRAAGPLPDYEPVHGYADHVRVFTEAEIRERFGQEPGFALHKIPGRWKPGEFPDSLIPVEFGSFFVAVTKPGPDGSAA